jgi:arginyl-tRNA synthetase
LLRLAHQEGLIQFHDIDDEGNFLLVQPIFWLDQAQKLHLDHRDEINLLHELVQAVDDWVCPDHNRSVDWEKFGGKLSEAFNNFWRYCRIWGNGKIISPEIVQARLGLLLGTQVVLKKLLTQKLGISAPWEI